METPSLLAFVAAALAVLVIPGPGVLYIVARSLTQGHRAGLVSAAGLWTGALAHVAAATAGLSAILLTSATAFSVVKLMGAAYLIYLGVWTLLSPHSATGLEEPTPRSLRRLFRDGVVISVFNPKIALFFLAFLPQFVDPGRGPATLQILLLGLLYVGMASCTDSTYALLAGGIGRSVGGRVMRGPLPHYASGTVYIGLGVGMLVADRR